ncbi:hypothetical protein A3A93_01465 [Candidatus Roizmanbacteria bacterium RIFCSPLOWO2_01_FULL_38_12]|uniref:Uncharacterized protein n=1 Tax=Candidatus Roizmanbacteria bacterium RIFCSPLOWO2_01_FULL_38_12 TaxID=1802061 RepID=A0A1F7IY49_9BACT|nr:MAG: hypothetical protein A2861_00625 [Candidatus Roizmanbacteria bacterium RIFCSPHIGHO2_01_FULL_38_15]OGK34460.1 MAG: hypothetical protein A3F59_03990 [Candidatus Roizmanbacteria bacterium RIFCSPHIGHO2_12_FULL_38_13]OGK48290.1 MAG: hypothetical protein A3A93_01465 [Candidatus Roizmanbacteria bacterium RIFCSPLOWO2_01_FULL_38_12]
MIHSENKDKFILTLHRYFIWALYQHNTFKTVIRVVNTEKTRESARFTRPFGYGSYWYASMYVVIEGWLELKLHDKKIDVFLKNAKYIQLLRRYRNGVFHFQKDYEDNRFEIFFKRGSDFNIWVDEIYHEFDRFFLEWSKKEKSEK